MKFFHASDDEILRGETTDIYFKRTEEILKVKNASRKVEAEFTLSSFPRGYTWGIFAGLEEVLRLLEGKPLTVKALPEGMIFRNRDDLGVPVPVLTIEGDYVEFAVYETPILGFLCQSSGIATKSARVRISAGDNLVLSFGIRRMHPALAPLIDRSAYIGGCDGVSGIMGAKAIGKSPQGTMPHSLILIMGEEEAWRAFDEVISEEVPRVALIDTFGDEKQEALKAAEILKNLKAVRLDTPGSRRGNFAQIIKEVRWELDVRGYKNVGIFVSGGLDERSVKELKEAGAIGFGVGTSISNAPTLDFAMDIVSVEGKPLAKKGKFSGEKDVWYCPKCYHYKVTLRGSKAPTCPRCGKKMKTALTTVIKEGERVYPEKSPDEIRAFVLEQLKNLPEEDREIVGRESH